MIMSAVPTRLPAARTRRAIPLSCCGCTGRWSTPSWSPEPGRDGAFAADSNRYVAEMVTAAELTGVPRHLVPSSVPELDLYIASVRPTLRCTPAAAESMAYLLDPPGLDEDIAEFWQDVRDAAIAVLPRWARQMYGYGAPPPLTPGRRTEIRQSLGVLDTMFLGQPGVLEARQRITLRMRAGAAAHEAHQAPRRGDGGAPRPWSCFAAGPDGCALIAPGRRSGWPRAAGPATRPARRGCSRPRASSASCCARTWPCRPPKTSPAPWGR